jgi:hypothetical protein
LVSAEGTGKINGDSLSDWAAWSVVEQSSKQIGIVAAFLKPQKVKRDLERNGQYSHQGDHRSRIFTRGRGYEDKSLYGVLH